MLDLSKISYRYKNRLKFTLRDIDLQINQGEMLLIAGRTGCGKSTLLKVMNGLLSKDSKGELKGQVKLNSENLHDMSIAEIGLKIGTVYQTPDDQLFAMSVADEVAFILENQNFLAEDITKQVTWALKQVGLAGLEKRSIHTLSGGQRQRLALASVIVSKPQILILDEPISQMNPAGVLAFLELLSALNKKLNMTIIIVEHRVHELINYFERIVFLEAGKVVYDGKLKTLWSEVSQKTFFGLREPELIRLAKTLKLGRYYLDLEELATEITNKYQFTQSAYAQQIISTPIPPRNEELLMKINNLHYTYPNSQKETLQGVNFYLKQGEVVALMGSNGAGKSTILNLIAGLIKNYQGEIDILGDSIEVNSYKLGFLRQEPDLMLLADTVREEIYWKNKKLDNTKYLMLIKQLGLEDLVDDFPLALSKGQRLRVVLASILAREPKILLLDEPTTGQDQESLNDIKKVIKLFKEIGGVLFCTHDVELAAQIADRVILLNQGCIISQGASKQVLVMKENLNQCGVSQPPMLEVSEKLQIPPCITVEEVFEYVR